MLKFQIIHFFRHIKNSKLISAINITGLSVGLACVMIMVMVIIHHLSFDRFHKKGDNIYRIIHGKLTGTSFVLGSTISSEIPEVESVARLFKAKGSLVKLGTELASEEEFFMADEELFDILTFKYRFGNREGLLDSPDKIVLSFSAAKKYFGKNNPIGEILEVNLFGTEKQFTVSGVFHDYPYTSSFSPDFISHIDLSFIPLANQNTIFYGSSHIEKFKKEWKGSNYTTLLLAKSNVNPDLIIEKLNTFPDKYPITYKKDYDLQPLKKMHLYSENYYTSSDFIRTGDRSLVKYCTIISLIILLIACFNLILLSTADTEKRFKAIAIRQVNGASVNQIRRMIILQNCILAIVCFLPALFLAVASIPFLNTLLGTNLHYSQIFEWKFLSSFFAISLVTGILSGAYISVTSGTINLTELIKGSFSNPKQGNFVFNLLMTLQFIFFIGLGVCALIISRQINYSLNKDQGFEVENVLVIPLESNTEIAKTLITELNESPYVNSAAGTSLLPPSGLTLPLTVQTETGEKIREEGLMVAQDFLTTMKVPFFEGSDFTSFNTVSKALIINEMAAEKHNVHVGDFIGGLKVHGVIPNIHLHSTHQTVNPLFILQVPIYRSRYVVASFNKESEKEVRELAGNLWNDLNAEGPVESFLLTDQISELYEKEKKQLSIISSFTLIAIILSSLGLFGFATLAIMRKTKEIGIRKVNGAKTAEIVFMLNNNMIKWIWIAFVVAGSVSYLLMSKWLNQFAYKTNIGWWIFLIAGALAFGIALLTVSWQSWRAATRNPVEALRYE